MRQSSPRSVVAALILAQLELDRALQATALTCLIPQAVRNELFGMRDDLARIISSVRESPT